MDGTSPWLDPRFLLAALGAYALLVMWLARMEFVTKANTTRQKEYEEYMDERVNKLEANHDVLKRAFYEHKGDAKVHHNEEAFKEFREGLNQRFSNFDNKLSEIKSLIISNHKER